MRVPNPKSLLLALVLALAAPVAPAADPEEARQLVRENTTRMLEVLRSEAAGDDEMDMERIHARLEEWILPHLDFVTMTKLAVGRDWLQAGREQKRTLVRQFRTLLVNTYARSLQEYNDQGLEFLPLEAEADTDRVKVRSRVTQSGDGARVPVDYSMRHHNGNWQVYDITVDGISLVTTYRSSFSDIVSSEGIDGLIAYLERKNASGEVEPPSS